MECRIILVDDHSLFRNGLRELLERCEGCRVVGEAASGEEFLAMMEGMESESISFHMFPVSSLLFPLFSVFPCCSISAASYLLLFVGPVHGEGLHIIIL